MICDYLFCYQITFEPFRFKLIYCFRDQIKSNKMKQFNIGKEKFAKCENYLNSKVIQILQNSNLTKK